MEAMNSELENDVRRIAGKEIFLQGRAVLMSGKVASLSHKSFWKNERVITAEVCGHDVRLTVTGDRIAGYGCSCDYFKENKGMCGHIAAAALCYGSNNASANGGGVVYTSKEGSRMMSAYMKNMQSAYVQNVCAQNVCRQTAQWRSPGPKSYIDVDIHIYKEYDECTVLGILITKRPNHAGVRTRSVHGLKEFFENCDIDDYEDDNAGLISFLKKRAAEQAMIQNFSENSGKNAIYIYGEHVDDLFELQKHRTHGSIYYEGSEIRNIEKNLPKLHIDITGIGTGGYRVTLRERLHVIKTFSKLHVICNGVLYMIEGEHVSRLEPFLAGMSDAEMSDNRPFVDIERKDMPAFYNLVINAVNDYAEINYNGIDVSEFNPDMLTVEFDIECDKNGDLTIKPFTEYNGEMYDIFSETGRNMFVKRDYEAENRIKSVINKYFGKDMRISGDAIDDIYRLMDGGIKELESAGEVHTDGKTDEYKILKAPSFKAGLYLDGNRDDTLTANLLKIDVEALGYTKQELDRIFEGYKEKKKLIKLDSRGILNLDDDALGFLSILNRDMNISSEDIINNRIFVPRYRILYLDKNLKNIFGDYDRNAQVDAILKKIAGACDIKYEIPIGLRDILRDYQKTGYSWLKSLDECGFGGILADDMGLGKTIQIIALILSEKSKNNTTLIVTPASLIYNWENEINRFAGELTHISIVGSKSEREALARSMEDYDVVITSYDLLKRDSELYKNICFRFHVIDEAQYIKNPATENARCVKKINSMTRIALTGTPIENRLSELWSIFDFVLPGALYGYDRFKEVYEQGIIAGNEKETENLRNFISPFVLRRMKTDVLKELPEKLEYEMYTKMEGEQDKLYVANALRLRKMLEASGDDEFNSNKVQIFAELTRLRQICCDPSLCYEDYSDESCKLQMCMDLIDNGIEGGHKILIFSQFTSMLDIMGGKLKEKGIRYYMLVGSTKKELRVKMADAFNSDDTPLFLISLKAGGTGINLTAADMVIHYDPWWNYAAEQQATDRTHRIGQKNIVSVFKLLTKDTVEEYILNMQRRKEKLARDVLSVQNTGIAGITRDELIKLLDTAGMEKI